MGGKVALKGVREPGGAVLHENLTLIEVDDPAMLAELRADRSIGPLLLATLSERVAVVAPGRTEELTRRLLKAGHTPKMVSG